MICFKYPTKALVFLCLFHIVLPSTVYAYLDPGTGSYILQMAIAGVLGGLYALKLFWKNIKTFFNKIFSREGKNDKISEQ